MTATRCAWPGNDPLMLAYHDDEWGVPVHDDRKHFEFLILEGAQAGLSWKTILYKREGYRKAFADFDPAEGRALRCTEGRAAAARREHHPQPPEDRGRDQERQGLSRGPEGVRQLRRVLLAVRRRRPEAESPPRDRRRAGDDTRIGRVQQGSEAARLQLRRLHRHLRAHAGRRHGQRPPRRLLPPPRDQRAAIASQRGFAASARSACWRMKCCSAASSLSVMCA